MDANTAGADPASSPTSSSLIPTYTTTIAANDVSKDSPKVRRHPDGMLNVEPFGSYVAIFTRNQAESPLLRLPAEIRNRIYELFIGKRIVTVKDPFLAYRVEFNNGNLTPVCRQLYLETSVLYYSLAQFGYYHLGDLGLVGRATALATWQWNVISTVRIWGYLQSNSEARRSVDQRLAEYPGLRTVILIDWATTQFEVRRQKYSRISKEIEEGQRVLGRTVTVKVSLIGSYPQWHRQ